MASGCPDHASAPLHELAKPTERPSSSLAFVTITTVPASCGPVSINGVNEPTGSSLQIAPGIYTFDAPTCAGEGPLPTVVCTGGISTIPPYTQIGISGNGSVTTTYWPPLSISITGPTSGTVGVALGFRLDLSGGNTVYTELWAFGDATRKVNTTGSLTATHIYSAAGTHPITVWVNDTEPEVRVAYANVTITGGSSSSGGSPLSESLIIGVIVVIAIVAIAVVVLRSRRGGGEPSARKREGVESWSSGKAEKPAEEKASSTGGDGASSPSDQA